MIRITPYYMLDNDKRDKILALYLETVASVVPFLPEDVLKCTRDEVPKYLSSPRKRNEKYLNLLDKYGLLSEAEIGGSLDADARLGTDALLARKMVFDFSKQLGDWLYEGHADGHADAERLRFLLTFKMEGGALPSELVFTDCKGEKSAESKALLDHVFRYDEFSASENVYKILRKLGVEVCPYCNRQFITTYAPGPKDRKKKDGGSGEGEKPSRTRAQLDHFKVKSKYPYLALSINNLIPSCGVCNHMKGENASETLYPYSEGLDDRYVFSTDIPDQKIAPVLTGARVAPEHFSIRLAPADGSDESKSDDPFIKRAAASKKVFGLDGLYQAHRGCVADMYFQRYIFTPQLVESMAEQFGEIFDPEDTSGEFVPLPYEGESEEEKKVRRAKEKLRFERRKSEILRILLLMRLDNEHGGERPLSKLARDIEAEIEREYGKLPEEEWK